MTDVLLKIHCEATVVTLTVKDGRLMLPTNTIARLPVPADKQEGETLIVPCVRFNRDSEWLAAIPLAML